MKLPDAELFQEPFLEFANGQKSRDPRRGLSLFGPCDLDEPTHPSKISYGVVGTRNGIELFDRFSNAIRTPILSAKGVEKPLLWPPFPGFASAFHCEWQNKPSATGSINSDILNQRINIKNAHKRVGSVVDLYVDAIQELTKSDSPLNVIVCIVPDLVSKNCRPLSVVDGESARTSEKEKHSLAKQMDLFESYKPEHFQYSVDFRRQIKARSMKLKVPIQIILESTLELDSVDKTPLSDRAWNLSTTLFYKAGGRPWRLTGIRDGVCYIGIAFKRTDASPSSKSACAAAQMFLRNGDGVVFKGDERGVQYSPRDRTFHLSKQGAADLLHGVLDSYIKNGGKPLKEIFIHCNSSIDAEEYEGFRSVCPKDIKLVGVRVRKDRDFRLFREGKFPVIRGSFLKLSDRSGLLWGAGYKNELQTYDGVETPLPLRIDLQHGEASIEAVAADIFGLTKLNFNACRISDSEPVTIGFSDEVGEILISNPSAKAEPQFKFYI